MLKLKKYTFFNMAAVVVHTASVHTASVHTASTELSALVENIDDSTLDKILALPPRLATEITTLNQAHGERATNDAKKIASQQALVWQLTTASNIKTNSVLAFDAAKVKLNNAQHELDAMVERRKAGDASDAHEVNSLRKAEADVYLWAAQLSSDKSSKMSSVYFRVAIGRYRGLYGISTDEERDAWLTQMPSDTTKLISAMKLSYAVLSSFDGLLGEASCCVARGNIHMRRALEQYASSSSSAETDVIDVIDVTDVTAAATTENRDQALHNFATALRIFRVLGNQVEVNSILKEMANFYRACGNWSEAASKYHAMVAGLQTVQDIGGMVRASINETLMFLQVFREKKEDKEKDKDQDESVWLRWLRKASNASRVTVEMINMIDAEGLRSVLDNKQGEDNSSSLVCQTWRTRSSIYQAAWEYAQQKNDIDTKEEEEKEKVTEVLSLSTEELPLDDAKKCADLTRTYLKKALDETTSSSSQRAQLHLELGAFEFKVVMAIRSEDGLLNAKTALINAVTEHEKNSKTSSSEGNDAFEGQLYTHLASVETMLGQLPSACNMYEKAAAAFEHMETARGNKQAAHCRSMCVRLGDVGDVGGRRGVEQMKKGKMDQERRTKAVAPPKFVMDTEGIDSDDELGEELGGVE